MLDPVQILLQKMIQRGFDPIEAVGLVTEVLATRGKPRSAGAIRQERYRRNKASQSDTSQTVTNRHKPSHCYGNASQSDVNDGIYVETPYVKPMEVKEEAIDVEVKEVPLKQVTVKQGAARERKKSGIEIPLDWPTPELIEIGIGFGFSLEETQNELAAMQDWALSKDERRVNWKAFARNWFRTAKKGTGYSNGQRNGNGNGNGNSVVQASRKLVETIRRFEAGSGDLAVRGGAGQSHVRLLPER